MTRPVSTSSYRELARELGVSHNAVKMAIKGQPGLSDETRTRILRLARGRGYPSVDVAAMPRVVAFLPGAAAWAPFARLVVEGLSSRGFAVDCREEISPSTPGLKEACGLLYFAPADDALAALQRALPELHVTTFLGAREDIQADVFEFEAVRGWGDPALHSPGEFLLEEHCGQIAWRLQDRQANPQRETWQCLFHHPRQGSPSARYRGTPVGKGQSRRPSPTLGDIARAVGTSASTVSLALQGRRTIADGTRQRIVRVAWRMGYRHFNRKRTGDIVVFDQWPIYPNHIFNRFCSTLKEVAEKGSDEEAPISHITTLDPVFVRHCLHNLRPDGALFFYDRKDILAEVAESLDPVTCPSVSLISSGHGMDSVLDSNVQGMRRLIRHFLRQGCRRFGFVGTEYATGTAFTERFATFHDELGAAGLAALSSWIRLFPEKTVGGWGHNPGKWYPFIRSDIEAALSCGGDRPEVLLCYNDEYAFSVASVLRDLGLGHIRLAGWGNRSLLEHCCLPVATIEPDLKGIAAAALRLLALRSEEPFAPLQTVLVNNRLVLREPL